jgi:hypothetical protein
MRRAAIAGLITALTAAPAEAAPPSEHRYQTWLAAFVHGPIKGHAWFWTDAQLRLYENFEPSAILLRPGFSWKVGPPVYLTAGYAWTPSWQRPGERLDFIDEHRAWEQIMWTPSNEATGTAAILRARLEQRMRPADHRDTGLRARFMWRGQVPISRRWPVIFVVWDEVFVALNDAMWGQKRGFDQNRAFAGVGWQIRPTIVRVEIGYTNVWLVREGPDPVNHIIAVNTFLGWHPRASRRKR